MSEQNLETFDIPGIGELRARPGTSTAELAGAVKYWHDKYQKARLDGFIGGAGFAFMFSLVSYGAYYLLR